ncbi:MAG TPA: polysaccharide biosynthesis/export family protein [Methylomirabilota bacterium]|jgi:polysaccharide export outer membrane protein|nr:polysaccharide biosynthesis/export family protein [Methylomirabilota bacterium]
MLRELLCSTLIALAAVAAPDIACAEGQAAVREDRTAPFDEYRIGPEDTLQISVWKNDPMSKTVPVRPDGLISLPLLGDIRAAGSTPTELRDVLVKRLSEYMPTPEVAVIVTEVRSFKVSVIGEVHKPARYELKSWTTVLDILALAGGLNEFAARTRIVILRNEGRGLRRIPFNYNKVVSSGGEAENFFLRPNDIVLVP